MGVTKLSGPLLGFTTIVLHQGEQIEELISLIESAGGEAIAAQLLGPTPLTDDTPALAASGTVAPTAQREDSLALGAWYDGDVDAVVLTSPAVVREFAKQFDPLETIPQMAPYLPVLICGDKATTIAANANGLSVDLVANQPTISGLLSAVLRAADLTQEYDQHL